MPTSYKPLFLNFHDAWDCNTELQYSIMPEQGEFKWAEHSSNGGSPFIQSNDTPEKFIRLLNVNYSEHLEEMLQDNQLTPLTIPTFETMQQNVISLDKYFKEMGTPEELLKPLRKLQILVEQVSTLPKETYSN